jgi:hypothetical protein
LSKTKTEHFANITGANGANGATKATKATNAINGIVFKHIVHDNTDYKNMILSTTSTKTPIDFTNNFDINIKVYTGYNQISMPRFFLDLKADNNEDYILRIVPPQPDEKGVITIALNKINFTSINETGIPDAIKYVNNLKNYINYKNKVLYWKVISYDLADIDALDYNPIFIVNSEISIVPSKAKLSLQELKEIAQLPGKKANLTSPLIVPVANIPVAIVPANVPSKDLINLLSMTDINLIEFIKKNPAEIIILAIGAPDRLLEIVKIDKSLLDLLAKFPDAINDLAKSSPKTLAYFASISPAIADGLNVINKKPALSSVINVMSKGIWNNLHIGIVAIFVITILIFVISLN